MQLRDRKCVPCQGGVPPLGETDIQRLLPELDERWRVEDQHHLARDWAFRDFASALAFTNQVGEVAEAEGHHPDIELAWGRVSIRLFTHKIDGLSESDFILAAKIDGIGQDG